VHTKSTINSIINKVNINDKILVMYFDTYGNQSKLQGFVTGFTDLHIKIRNKRNKYRIIQYKGYSDKEGLRLIRDVSSDEKLCFKQLSQIHQDITIINLEYL